MLTAKRNRNAFTLLELLVVVAIIGVLASLTAGAVFRLRSASQETRTNETLSKIQMGYQQQYKSAVDSIRKEQIPPELIAAANNDMDLAKAVHLKLRLRREFPQNVSDVDDTGATTGSAALDTTLRKLYPIKATFNAMAPFLKTLQVNEQNSVLLYAVLSQARGGSTFSPEQVGSNAIGNLSASTPQKVFVDGYGNPIYFVRALSTPPVGDAYIPVLIAELNAPPYTTVAAAAAKKGDALDPTARFTAPTSLASFVAQMRAYMNEPLDGTNRGPFVFSAGSDGVPFTPDDLYSFRLSGTGKAN